MEKEEERLWAWLRGRREERTGAANPNKVGRGGRTVMEVSWVLLLIQVSTGAWQVQVPVAIAQLRQGTFLAARKPANHSSAVN